MVPHLGAGAGTGIDVSVFASFPMEERPHPRLFLWQDSYILAALLTNSSIHVSPSEKEIQNIVDVYNNIRVPRGTGMLKSSIDQGHLYYFAGEEFDDYKEGDEVPWDLVHKTGVGINENWTWTPNDPKIERRIAESLLEEMQSLETVW